MGPGYNQHMAMKTPKSPVTISPPSHREIVSKDKVLYETVDARASVGPCVTIHLLKIGEDDR
jgi:hypothetical protein